MNNYGFSPTRIMLILIAALACSVSGRRAHGEQDGFSASVAPRTYNPWGANYFPNVVLTAHDGRKLRFFDDLIKDKIVVINFMYTTCPDVCPVETSKLCEVQAILGDRVGKTIFMMSITIDPANDTPEVLAKYRERFGVREGWDFLTGNEADILLLRKRLGLYLDDLDPEDKDHNISMVIGNQRTGQWTKKSPFNEPYRLAMHIGCWLDDFKTQPNFKGSRYQDGYDNAPTNLSKLTRAESLYLSRCLTCHNIGRGDGKQKIGPNLLDVTQRHERSWLLRWIMEPDKMLEEKDPNAMALFREYNQVSMPNLSLGEHEASILLEYIETESRRAKRVEVVEEIQAEQGKGGEGPGCCEKGNNAILTLVDSPHGDSIVPEKETVALSRAEAPRNRPMLHSFMLLLGAGALLLAIRQHKQKALTRG
jgi:cytochrome oxidase Cu insertion factor (SCO1/SenC/PrrC family)